MAGNAMVVTRLTPIIGYDKADEIVREAAAEGKSIRDAAGELTALDPQALDRLLDPERLTGAPRRKRGKA